MSEHIKLSVLQTKYSYGYEYTIYIDDKRVSGPKPLVGPTHYTDLVFEKNIKTENVLDAMKQGGGHE